jgi:hypothetical protein
VVGHRLHVSGEARATLDVTRDLVESVAIP